ncbi:MAG: sulfate adenylyltransferase [Candidatus Melainabacteria bacterium RIFCSPLOWO2_02_FULL_35_15]|nr:MAG: sulfate adenylyltransferase [Candidatus Melainabacteria bacterium RIFCSPLOWO2_12_FULL_35_11]OGI13817.1 MAG: sulfate adenylyltransferase [Candidatus Melainabacteria bacterium RIFCSPLOWO2_02_FULL_35_15]
MKTNEIIPPHGNSLINCFAQNPAEVLKEAREFTSVIVSKRVLCDLEMLAIGAFSPLNGFTGKKDYESIIESMRLSNGLIWPIPITLQVNKETYEKVKNQNKIALKDESDEIVAVLNLKEIYQPDLKKEAELVFKTLDTNHPAVKYLFEAGEYYLAGDVKVLKSTYDEFPEYNLGCTKTREIFSEKGWKQIVAFQTRNPVHRAHEYLLRVALETVDGLMLHPTMGETKGDDIPANIRMKCYKEILEKYFPKNRTLLCIMPASMRYAGPREAVLHAIIRRNYGCTHFIVGRDHAGVGNYYGTYDAQKIFSEFKSNELGITLLFFEHSFYCKACDEMASYKTCPHDASSHMILSGTKVREMLRNGEMPPVEFTRPEIAKILIDSMRQKIPT